MVPGYAFRREHVLSWNNGLICHDRPTSILCMAIAPPSPHFGLMISGGEWGGLRPTLTCVERPISAPMRPCGAESSINRLGSPTNWNRPFMNASDAVFSVRSGGRAQKRVWQRAITRAASISGKALRMRDPANKYPAPTTAIPHLNFAIAGEFSGRVDLGTLPARGGCAGGRLIIASGTPELGVGGEYSPWWGDRRIVLNGDVSSPSLRTTFLC